jgi:hypothetical protein
MALVPRQQVAYLNDMAGAPVGTGCRSSLMKPRPPRRRKSPAPRDALPPDVPEVATAAPPATEDKSDAIPDHIRRMLEAAYT